MPLYIARKGNGQFYVQPEMVEAYANMGYTIIKLEEKVIEDIQAEAQIISEMEEV